MLALGVSIFLLSSARLQQKSQASLRKLWQIGNPAVSTSQFGLAPGGFADYRCDALYIVGESKPKDLPYVLPGPADQWAGSKRHSVVIVFGLKPIKVNGELVLDIKFADAQDSIPPKITTYCNHHLISVFQSPAGGGDDSIHGVFTHAVSSEMKVQIPSNDVLPGNNVIRIVNGEGSWILFKSLRLAGPKALQITSVQQELRVRQDAQAQIVYRTKNGAMQPCDYSIENIGPDITASYSLLENKQLVKHGDLQLKSGRHHISFAIPQILKPQDVTLQLRSGSKLTLLKGKEWPIRHWVIDLMPHAHLDVGYTDTQTQVSKIQRQNLLYALQVRQQSLRNPKNSRYHYNFEGTWILNQALKYDSPTEIKEIKQGFKEGALYCSAAYANELTGLMRDEEMMESYRLGQILGSKFGTKLTVATQTDVPGVTWGDTVALHAAGVKALLLMPNPADRLGDVIRDWQDQPFWWQTPDGKHKILVWETVTYGMAHGIRPFNGDRYHILRTKNPDKDFIGRYIFPRLSHLAISNYPYRLIAIPWSDTDNSPVDGDVPQAAKDWNRKYVIPEVRLSTFRSASADMIRLYGSALPIERGDLSPYWEDGAGSSAKQTSMNRWSADRLVQAEALDAIRRPAAYKPSQFLNAWSNVILYSEHTWGSYDSVSNPNDPFTKSVWRRKKKFATDARKESIDLLNQSLEPVSSSASKHSTWTVWNTDSWNRSGVIFLSRKYFQAGDQAETWPAGKKLITQELANDKLEIEVPSVPAFGSVAIRVRSGPAQVSQNLSAHSDTLQNRYVIVHINPQTGAIDHLIDRKSGHDFVKSGSLGLNRYQYLIGGNVKDVQYAGHPHITVVNDGPVVATLQVASSAPGTMGMTVQYTLTSSSPEVRITNILDKLPVLKKESVHFAFPFAVRNGLIRDDLPWSVIQPETDQLPGANRNWLTCDRFIDVSNRNLGVTLVCEDAPLIEIGGITANIMGGGYQSSDWIKHLPATQTIESWALNNIWYTNYRAEQSGKLIFRYRLWPHQRFDEARSFRYGTDATQPLIPVAGVNEAQTSLCQIIGKGVVATCLKPCDDGHGYILRVWGASSHDHVIKLRWRNDARISVWKSDLREDKFAKLDANHIQIPAYGEETLRIKVAG